MSEHPVPRDDPSPLRRIHFMRSKPFLRRARRFVAKHGTVPCVQCGTPLKADQISRILIDDDAVLCERLDCQIYHARGLL